MMLLNVYYAQKILGANNLKNLHTYKILIHLSSLLVLLFVAIYLYTVSLSDNFTMCRITISKHVSVHYAIFFTRICRIEDVGC
jgi:hypothetical protein